MMPSDIKEFGLIHQRRKYPLQALFWYSLHLSYPQRKWKDQKCGKSRSQAMKNLSKEWSPRTDLLEVLKTQKGILFYAEIR